MNCDETRQHWHLFHDSEGDAELHLQINEHLRDCPECSRWFFQESRLEEAVTAKLREGEPTGELWKGIHDSLTVRQPVASCKWVLFGLPALLAASLLLAVVLWPSLNAVAGPDLAGLSAQLHQRLSGGEERVALVSQSDHEVEEYLRPRVPFPVRCPPRGDAGFQVQGAGTTSLANDPVAYVVGRVDGRPVSVFIMDRQSLRDFPAQERALRRAATYQSRQGNVDIVMSQVDRNLVMVVGRLDSRQLQKVLNAYGTYHDHQHQAPHSRQTDSTPI